MAKKDKCDVEKDMLVVLSDVLVPENEASRNTIEDRFQNFKDKELKRGVSLPNKCTQGGMHSFFCIPEKAVDKFKLETEISMKIPQ